MDLLIEATTTEAAVAAFLIGDFLRLRRWELGRFFRFLRDFVGVLLTILDTIFGEEQNLERERLERSSSEKILSKYDFSFRGREKTE